MSFDPYYQWLGIPPDEQPPHFYKLLGLRLYETNDEAIGNAADRQMIHLRTFQSGKNSADSQKLMNEVSAARVCLLNKERKAAYDVQLQAFIEHQRLLATSVELPPSAHHRLAMGKRPMDRHQHHKRHRQDTAIPPILRPRTKPVPMHPILIKQGRTKQRRTKQRCIKVRRIQPNICL